MLAVVQIFPAPGMLMASRADARQAPSSNPSYMARPLSGRFSHPRRCLKIRPWRYRFWVESIVPGTTMSNFAAW